MWSMKLELFPKWHEKRRKKEILAFQRRHEEKFGTKEIRDGRLPPPLPIVPGWKGVRYDKAFEVPVEGELLGNGTNFSLFHGVDREGSVDLVDIPYTPFRLMTCININEQILYPGNTFEKQLNQMATDYLKGTNTVGLWHDTDQKVTHELEGWVDVPGMERWKSNNASILDSELDPKVLMPYLQSMVGRSAQYEQSYKQIRAKESEETEKHRFLPQPDPLSKVYTAEALPPENSPLRIEEIDDFMSLEDLGQVNRYLVRDYQNQIIGYADVIALHKEIRRNHPVRVLAWMYIEKEFQDSGYGSTLLSRVQEDFKKEEGRTGKKMIELTWDFREDTDNILFKNGWEEVNPQEDRRNGGVNGVSYPEIYPLLGTDGEVIQALLKYEYAIDEQVRAAKKQGKHIIEMESRRVLFTRK